MISKKKINKKISGKNLKKINNKSVGVKDIKIKEKKIEPTIIKSEEKKPRLFVEKKKEGLKNIPEVPKTELQKEIKDVKAEEIIPIIPLVAEEKIITPVIEEKIVEKKKENSKKVPDDDYQEDKNKVEALLFACGKYIEDQTISELCVIDKKKLHKMLEDLRKDYESKNNALMIFNEGTSWKINVREKYLSTVRKIVADTELPKSVMETLAVIAWKTPIYQSEVVRIRGNKCYDHIEVLEDAGFVSKEKKGRSYVLKATEKFFTYFEIDRGNLKGVFDTVKVPEIREEQKTLEQTDIINEDEKDKIQAIELKKWTETEEEKEGHKQFLEQIENKIKEAKEKNELFAQEIPTRVIENVSSTSEVQETSPDILNNTSGSTAVDETQIITQNPLIPEVQNHPQKPKSLTKKQLEKKFKDELLRVREKIEKKQK